MFKRTIAMMAGVLLLATGATESRAAGLDLNSLGFEAGAQLFAPIDPVNVVNLGLFTVDGNASTGDLVTINQTATGFDLTIGPFGGANKIFGSSTGTAGTDFATMDGATSDLIEILFSLSTNDGSLTTSSLVLASLTGDFFSTDPISGLPINALTDFGFFGSGALTLTAVNQVPLPAGIVLLLTALGGLVLVRRRSAV